MKQEAEVKELKAKNAMVTKQLQRYMDGYREVNRGFRYMCVAFNGCTQSCPQVKFMSDDTLNAAFEALPAIKRAAAAVKAREQAARTD